MLGHITTLGDVDLKKGRIREPGKYTRRQKQVFSSDTYGAAPERKNSFVQVGSARGKESVLLFAKIFLLCRVSDRGDSEIRKYAFL